MKSLKTFVANLANKINQPHHLEVELRKVFNAGIKYSQENKDWVCAKVCLPDFLPDVNYSENVLAIVEGLEGVHVMCFTRTYDDDCNMGKLLQ